MKRLGLLTVLLPLIGAMSAIQADSGRHPLVVTASNAAKNQLLVYDPDGNLVQTLSTHGQGGASGNAHGIATHDELLAAVNFNSQTVAIFGWDINRLDFRQLVSAASKPVSVAFGRHHLYILGTTTVESHRIWEHYVSTSADGVAPLLKADGSSAQVGVLPGQLIISEKSNAIETVSLDDGAVTGSATLVSNIPANVDAPFGLITRGNNAYVTIAHADEISLVRNGTVLTTTPSGTQHAPCWLTLVGPFLFSSNTASDTISRYAVYGRKIVQDAAVAAQFSGGPSDIDYGDHLIAVIDKSGQVTHLSIFWVDEDGNLTLKHAVTIKGVTNGVAIVRGED